MPSYVFTEVRSEVGLRSITLALDRCCSPRRWPFAALGCRLPSIARPDRRSRNGDVKDVLAAEDDADAARWPVASPTRRRVKGDDYNAVLTVAQGSGNWQRVRAAAHGATPLSQLIWESRSPLSALPSFLPSREGPLYPLSNARFLISAPRRVAPRRSPGLPLPASRFIPFDSDLGFMLIPEPPTWGATSRRI